MTDVKDFLPHRDATADIAGIKVEELFAGSDHSMPLISIMIPTFRRRDLLVEAVASATAQDIQRPFEVVVVDDDPASTCLEALLRAVPKIKKANFRYIRNCQNHGYYENHNRCLREARGEWFTILHDDDLLDPDFARRMLDEYEANPRIDGLVCRKRTMDTRPEPYGERRTRAIAKQALERLQFRGRRTRPVTSRKLF